MSWENVLDAARNTVNKPPIGKEPSSEWKRKILIAEHSPIRELKISRTIHVPYWVAMHLRTHHVGIEHYISTSRPDRTGESRSPDKIVSHHITANAQAIINISRERLCKQSSKETREAWQGFLERMGEPELFSVCVPKCLRFGFCPEMKPCGYSETEEFKKQLKEYRYEEDY